MKKLMLFIFAAIQSISMLAQDDPILFHVGDEGVTTSEFMYIYNKNNSASQSGDATSIDEYLNLYKNFKLKVHHAKQLEMDTIQRLNPELAGYREQLAATYLNDNSVMSRLAAEAYERMQQEAEIRHILIKMPKTPLPSDTARSHKIALEIYDSLIKGQVEFEDAAKSMSQDASNSANGGYIGYVRAILPKGYYELETAIYNLIPGNISKPVRSPRGYHIVELISMREAKREREIAHILIRKPAKTTDDYQKERQQILSIHEQLTSGVPFQELAAKESQDAGTARKGGRIGYIKVGAYDPEFETAAFSLENDDEISQPVETRVGFHILKRIGIKENLAFKDAKRGIENELRRTERSLIARQTMIKRIKSEEGLKVNPQIQQNLFGQIEENEFFTYTWKGPEGKDDEKILTFNDGSYKTSADFINYLNTHPKERVRLKSQGKSRALFTMFQDFENEASLNLEKEKLETKHPEFAALMREYEEGILLFEITKENVWDKASSDTTGLKTFFANHRDNYVYPSEIDVITYTLTNTNAKKAKKTVKQIKSETPQEIAESMPNVPQDKKTLKRTDASADRYAWKVDQVTDLYPLGDEGAAFTVSKTIAVRPAKRKELNECRGYVIADYQEELEKNWIKELKNKYPIKENKSAIQALSAE